MTEFQDKTLVCVDCKNEFTFTAGEQEFYHDKGHTATKRCPDCRAAKKLARQAQENGGRSY